MASQNDNHKRECVVLLHGLARTRFSMRALERSLSQHYRVINLGYPSRHHTIERLAKFAIEPALAECEDATRIHFVTHSLGGILLREYCTDNSIAKLGNVVMLGPPNHGSELVDFFQARAMSAWLFDRANGPAGRQLGTDSKSKPMQLAEVDFKLGVIAGSRSLSPWLSRLMSGPNDGKVSVASAKLKSMSDFLIVPNSHTFMMRDRIVIEQVEAFLAHGQFRQS